MELSVIHLRWNEIPSSHKWRNDLRRGVDASVESTNIPVVVISTRHVQSLKAILKHTPSRRATQRQGWSSSQERCGILSRNPEGSPHQRKDPFLDDASRNVREMSEEEPLHRFHEFTKCLVQVPSATRWGRDCTWSNPARLRPGDVRDGWPLLEGHTDEFRFGMLRYQVRRPSQIARCKPIHHSDNVSSSRKFQVSWAHDIEDWVQVCCRHGRTMLLWAIVTSPSVPVGFDQNFE